MFRLTPREFNSYGSRRGNDAVMARGTFANIRLVNKLLGQAGPRTLHIPSGDTVSLDTILHSKQKTMTTYKSYWSIIVWKKPATGTYPASFEFIAHIEPLVFKHHFNIIL